MNFMDDAEIKNMNIYQRVHSIMGEVGNLPKTKEIKNNAGVVMYKVVEAEKLDAALRPLLVKYRVLIVPTIISLENEKSMRKRGSYENPEYHATVMLQIKWVNIDKPDDSFTGDWPGDGIDSGDKAIGKAGTYAFRIGRVKTLNISTGDPEPEEGSEENETPPQGEPSAQQNQNEKSEEGRAPTSGGAIVTQAQSARFLKFAKSLGIAEKEVKEYLAKNGFKSAHNITADKYELMREGLKQLAGGK
jgi:hypothetical protein